MHSLCNADSIHVLPVLSSPMAVPNVPPELTKPYHGHVLPTSTRLGNLENFKVFYILVGTTMHFEFGKLIHQKLRYGKKHHRLLPKKRGLCELNADDY